MFEDDDDDTKLTSGEVYWRDHQKWLEHNGYMLRPRYRPDWKPSWIGTDKHMLAFEDGLFAIVCLCFLCSIQMLISACQITCVMDATRISDGKLVLLKKIKQSVHPFEVEISKFFHDGPIASDPRNHCVPILDVLQDPDDENMVLLVMPFLREYDVPRFDTFGEVIECFRQLFEVCLPRFHAGSTYDILFQGLKFMHDHHVAHRQVISSPFFLDISRQQRFQGLQQCQHHDGWL